MAALTLKFSEDFEALVAGALAGQSTYTGAGGAPSGECVVNAGSLMSGVNCIAWTSGGAAAGEVAVETPIGYTRATTETWSIVFDHIILGAATATKNFMFQVTKGAINLATFATLAMELQLAKHATGSLIDMAARDDQSGTTFSSGVYPSDQKFRVKITFVGDSAGGKTYTIGISPDGSGDSYATIYSGTLKAGNEAFDRWSFHWQNGTYAST